MEGGRIKYQESKESRNVYTLGYPFLASSRELLAEPLTSQQLLSNEVEAKK